VIDGRDLKIFKNVASCWFDAEDDRHAWRGRLGVARAGLCELVLIGGGSLVAAILLGSGAWTPWWLGIPPALLAAFTVYFFRDPERVIPDAPAALVSPADGVVVDIEEAPDDPFIGGPTVKIGIFLSVFNVHVNRSVTSGKILRLEYERGEFLNAQRPESATANERMTIGIVDLEAPHRRYVLRQIVGMIARRIVCEIRPGQLVRRGERIGMIKFGSRTELVALRDGLDLLVRVGDRVRGGATVLARYRDQT
jgi:phosphatidylserine decarboxylase